MSENSNNNLFKSVLKELSQPFIDLAHTSRALFGVNLMYVFEGITYFGVVGLLAIFFNEYIHLSDVQASPMIGFLTGGITLAMLIL
ncbi:MAG: MFS transporter, partial [Candidatus Aminicenantes bacterium]|nr:MFS transporter [Candidatus Aminicenantes bacterium]